MLEELSRRFAQVRSPRCEAHGCCLRIAGTRRIFVLDFEAYCEDRGVPDERCDRVVFVCHRTAAILPVEIKAGKNVEARKASRQLQGAADRLPQLLAEAGAPENLHAFYPVLICGAVKHANELKVLLSRPVVYRGRRHRIIYKRCGSHIREILAPWPHWHACGPG